MSVELRPLSPPCAGLHSIGVAGQQFLRSPASSSACARFPDGHARSTADVVWDPARKQWIMYVRTTPTEGGKRIQSFTHTLTEDFIGAWAPAEPTGLNTTQDCTGATRLPHQDAHVKHAAAAFGAMTFPRSSRRCRRRLS